MKNLLKCQETMIILQKLYQIIFIIKRIGIGLSRQTNRNIPPKINFIQELEEDDGAKMFFIAEMQQKTIPNCYLDSLIVSE